MSQPPGRPREQAKRVVKAITPPALVSAARRVRDARATPAAPEWEYVAEGWDRPPRVRGWNEPSVVDAYRRKLPAFRAAVAGPQPLAVPTSPSIPIGTANVADQNQNLAFAYALLLASRSRERVSVLDWGGGVGYFALLCRTILPPEVDVDFHCRDVPLVCDAGRELLPEVTFWTDDACLEREYDLVVRELVVAVRRGLAGPPRPARARRLRVPLPHPGADGDGQRSRSSSCSGRTTTSSRPST